MSNIFSDILQGKSTPSIPDNNVDSSKPFLSPYIEQPTQPENPVLDNIKNTFSSILSDVKNAPVPKFPTLKTKINTMPDNWIPDNSTGGIVLNTIAGLPAAGVNVFTDIFHGITRGVGNMALTVGHKINTNIPTTLNPEESNNPEIAKLIFGDEPISTYGTQYNKVKDIAAEKGAGKFGSPVLAAGVVGGNIASDLLNIFGFGGDKAGIDALKGEIPEQFLKFLAKNDTPTIEGTLKNIGVDPLNSKILAEKLGPEKTIEGVKNILIEHQPAGIIPKENITNESSLSNADSLPGKLQVEPKILPNTSSAENPFASILSGTENPTNGAVVPLADTKPATEGIMPKSIFSSPKIRELTPEEKPLVEKVNNVLQGNSEQEPIANIPSFVSRDGKERPLIFSKVIADKIISDHGKMIPENIVLNANDWDYVIKNVNNNPDKINLIKQIPNSNNFLNIGANKNNGFFIVTHYESLAKDSLKLKNLLKNKGDSLDRSGRAVVPSFATSPEGVASQLDLSGVRSEDKFGRTPKSTTPHPEGSADSVGSSPEAITVFKPTKSSLTKNVIPSQVSKVDQIERAVERAKAGEDFGPRKDGLLRNGEDKLKQKTGLETKNKLKNITDTSKSDALYNHQNSSSSTSLLNELATQKDIMDSYPKSISQILDSVKSSYSSKFKKSIPVRQIEYPKELIQRAEGLAIKKEAILNSPYRELLKYISKSGKFRGELPEVTGKGTEFGKRGDEIVADIFGDYGYENIPDSEEARAGMEKYLAQRKELFQDIKDLKTETAKFKNERRNQIIEERDNEALVEMARLKAQPLQQSLNEIEPPIVRGGIQAPRLELSKAKDHGWMARESLDRNVENTFTREDAKKINSFLGDHLRENYTKEIEYRDKKLKDLEIKMKELGIKPGSDESSFVQIYGEGKTNIDQLMKEFPDTWKNIEKAVSIFKDMYKTTLGEWNPMRKRFSYPEIQAVKDYFPHFDDISFWTKNYGILNNKDDLPTSIAGLTKNFQPGKTWNRHELHRIGNKTKYDAIAGAKEYINSVAKQMYTMDSIARANALLKYLRKSDEMGQAIGTPLKVSRFVTNLQEVKQNQLASKVGGLDRSIEEFGDRKIINSISKLSGLIGKNIIAFNPAAVMSHGVSLSLNAARVNKVDFIKGMMTTVSSPFTKDPYYVIDGQKSDLLFYRYPKEYLKTKFETVDEAGGWMIKQMDIFKVRTAVASKFYELTKEGIKPEIAIKEADKFAGRIVGDYSRGQKPVILNQKLVKILAQFQFGMNDGISVLLHDIPYQNKKFTTGPNGEKVIEMAKNKDGSFSEKAKNDYLKSIWQIASWMVFAYLMNEEVYKPIKGSGKGLSPVNLFLDLAGLDSATKDMPFPSRVGYTANELAGELPFTNVFFGNSPTASTISQTIKDLVDGKLLNAGIDIASTVISPIGGGSQLKKTITGLQTYNQGYATTKSGKPSFSIKKTPTNLIKESIFGPSSTEDAQNYYNSLNPKDSALNSPMKETYDQVQALDAQGKTSESNAIVDGLSDADYEEYKKVAKAVKAQKSDENVKKYLTEVLDSGIVQKVRELDSAGKTDKSDKLMADMFPDTPEGDAKYDAYKAAVKLVPKEGETTKNIDLISGVVTYAKAIGTDPLTAFNRIFTGQKITKVENGTVIVERMPLTQSQTIKTKLGGNSGMTLDHIIPLELGGSNAESNLRLYPKAKATEGDKVENYLGDKLKAGTITKKEAQDIMLKYKNGEITFEEAMKS